MSRRPLRGRRLRPRDHSDRGARSNRRSWVPVPSAPHPRSLPNGDRCPRRKPARRFRRRTLVPTGPRRLRNTRSERTRSPPRRSPERYLPSDRSRSPASNKKQACDCSSPRVSPRIHHSRRSCPESWVDTDFRCFVRRRWTSRLPACRRRTTRQCCSVRFRRSMRRRLAARHRPAGRKSSNSRGLTTGTARIS